MQNFEGQIRCIIGNVEVAYKLAIGVNLVRGSFDSLVKENGE